MTDNKLGIGLFGILAFFLVLEDPVFDVVLLGDLRGEVTRDSSGMCNDTCGLVNAHLVKTFHLAKTCAALSRYG